MVEYDTERDDPEYDFVKFISTSEARTSLSDIMALAASDDRVVITLHGRPKATIVSFDEYQKRLS